jgi:hypothetical protein
MSSDEIDGLLDRMNSTNLDGDDEPEVTDNVKVERTRSLEKILGSLAQQWESKSADLDGLLQKLGTGSRDGELQASRLPVRRDGAPLSLDIEPDANSPFEKPHGGSPSETRASLATCLICSPTPSFGQPPRSRPCV